ncbi:MAG: hypothetical protein KDE19_06750 [Caldilineaceae bacterium]|nr:hypothetical protein [Caldilineaceae bacterium]
MNQPKFIYKLLIVALLWSTIGPAFLGKNGVSYHVAYAQEGPSDYTFGDCSQIDKEELRAEIEQVAKEALTVDSDRIDIDQIVKRQWVTVGMDKTIDQAVDAAIERVYAEEGYWSRLWSGWSADKAEEFATRVANEAFSSAQFQDQITALSTAVADEIARDIEADFARAASAAFLCMKAYVGDKYSGTLFTTFEKKVSTEIDEVDLQSDATKVDVTALDVHQKALGGVGVIVVTEISRRLAVRLSEKIAERIAGKIIGRVLGKAGTSLIPVAGWVIGLGLIVWDLWEGGNGALPQISDALKSEEIKAKVRQEVAESVKNGLPEEVSIVALEIAVSLIEEWEGFCDTNRSVCTLALENSTFQDILDYTPLDQVSKVVSLVNIFVENLGRNELNTAINDGQFERLLVLPTAAYELLAENRSIEETLAWSALAGDQLERVLALGIPAQKAPTDFDQATLRAILNVDDQANVDKLLTLDRVALSTVEQFAGSNFVRLANRLSAEELADLAGYLAETEVDPALAVELASGTLTVSGLTAAAAAPSATETEPQTTTAATPTPDWLALMLPIQQFIAANSIVIAGVGLLCLVLLMGLVSRGRGSRRKRKRRDPYDIWGDM